MNGNELYVVTDRVEFFKYDLSNPRSPVLKSYYSDRLDGSYRRIQMIGDYAYLTSGSAGLRILYLGETNEVDDASPVPSSLALSPAYPNPFSGSTTITYLLPVQQHLSLDVYSTLGRKVQTLYSGFREPGTHTARLDASTLPAGMYRVALNSGEGMKTQMVVVR